MRQSVWAGAQGTLEEGAPIPGDTVLAKALGWASAVFT